MSGARGEGIIQLDDREVAILFTNRALAQAEKAMGKSVLGVVGGLADGQAGVGDAAHLLQAGMEAARRDARAGGRPVTLDDAYEVMDQAGFSESITVVVSAVAAVISYRRSSPEPGTSTGSATSSGEDEKNG
jgi:hypothetical protein